MSAQPARLCFWVITKHPRDFPAHYCLRRQWAICDGRGTIEYAPVAGLYGSLEEARFDVPAGLWCQPYMPGLEDPVIVETWF